MHNTLFQWEQRGWLRPMQPDGKAPEPGSNCQNLPEPQIILMGSGITDSRGEWTLTVPDALCPDLFAVDWVSLVATPSLPYNEDQGVFPPFLPEYVTTAWSTRNRLTLYVKSWQSNEPRAGVPFSWHAAVLHHLG